MTISYLNCEKIVFCTKYLQVKKEIFHPRLFMQGISYARMKSMLLTRTLYDVCANSSWEFNQLYQVNGIKKYIYTQNETKQTIFYSTVLLSCTWTGQNDIFVCNKQIYVLRCI